MVVGGGVERGVRGDECSAKGKWNWRWMPFAMAKAQLCTTRMVVEKGEK